MRVGPRIVFVLSFVLLAACSSRQAATPTAPSNTASAPAAPAATGTATIAGTVVGASTTSAAAWSIRAVNMTVSVVGSTSSATIDGNGHFTLADVPAGRVDLHFMGNGTDAHLVLDGVANNQTLTISVRVSGTSASLDDDHGGSGPNPTPAPGANVQVEGTVTALGASTLTVAGRLVNVTSTTVIERNDAKVALSSIHVGDRVEVNGTLASATAPDGPINATKIEVQNLGDDDNEDNDNNRNQVELKGAIATGSLAGSCATSSLTFKIGSTSVRTNASTKFDDTSCTALKAGDRVEVKGTRQADTSVLASKVEKDDD
ncbi:MAG TPA: DUF5666 domain-containing protein [Vicinamibacterales bacterium]